MDPSSSQLPDNAGPAVPTEGSQAAPARSNVPGGPAMPAMPLPNPATGVGQTPASDVTDTSTTGGRSLIEDADLIEKEWVNKAKAIVEQTRDDPHKQVEQLTAMKAEYMKQHYGKVIKEK